MFRLEKLLALTWPERRLLIVAIVLLPAAAVSLRLFGLRRTQAALACESRGGTALADDGLALARQTARIVAAAARYGPYRAPCLPLSLVLGRLLQQRGIKTDLRLGVRKAANGLEAHAWVEYKGLPLTENQDVRQRFAAFDKTFDKTDKTIAPAAATPE